MIDLKKNELLKDHTFYGIGGPADELVFIDKIEEFADFWGETIVLGIPKIILGGGSNLAFSDTGFRGRVFNLKFNNFKIKDNYLFAESGMDLQKVVEIAAENGDKKFANLSGIPGSLGGAIRGNAGAMGYEISNFLVGVEFVDENGKIQKYSSEKCHFAYRESIFKKRKNWVIIKGVFAIKKSSTPQEATRKAQEIKKMRWSKYPPGRSSGCVFKNPDNIGAGQILDECGAKGDRLGSLEISQDHANFFLNKGSATQKNLLELMRKWQKIVEKKRNIILQPEIFLCDEFGDRIEL
jgi:UDP-N-acetylmuramate dehydrogenase